MRLIRISLKFFRANHRAKDGATMGGLVHGFYKMSFPAHRKNCDSHNSGDYCHANMKLLLNLRYPPIEFQRGIQLLNSSRVLLSRRLCHIATYHFRNFAQLRLGCLICGMIPPVTRPIIIICAPNWPRFGIAEYRPI